MRQIYIARKYIANEGGARHYYEEGIFSSYELAYKFIIDISDEEDNSFLGEIVSYPLDSNSPCEEQKIFTFDKHGKLLITYDAKDTYDNCHVVEEDGYKMVYKNPVPESFSGRFKAGDIVFIRAFPWNNVSPTCIDTIGVISTVPISYDDWIANGNDKFRWENTYVVDCIRDGYIGHWHVEESGIKVFGDELPEGQIFLKKLSSYYQNKKVISHEIMKKILCGNIFIENVKHFDFEKM